MPEYDSEQTTAARIIIPDSTKEKQKIAIVVAIENIENAEIAPNNEVLYKSM